MKFTILFLSLFGAIMLGIIFHETIHLMQAKPPYSICYDINQKSFAHVDGDFESKRNVTLEVPAYILSIMVTITLFMAVYIDFKENKNTKGKGKIWKNYFRNVYKNIYK